MGRAIIDSIVRTSLSAMLATTMLGVPVALADNIELTEDPNMSVVEDIFDENVDSVPINDEIDDCLTEEEPVIDETSQKFLEVVEQESIQEESQSPVYSGEQAPEPYINSRQYLDPRTEKFIVSIGDVARYIAANNDLYASVMIAQAILESASGSSELASFPNNNLFGIKGDYDGQSVVMLTSEYDNGYYSVDSAFRKYPTVYESMCDYADLLVNNPWWYAGAWKAHAATYVDAANAVAEHYATDPSYALKLIAIIDAYALYEYDEPYSYMISGFRQTETGVEALSMSDYAMLAAELTSYLGTDYVWGGSTPDIGFDCSGLVQYCFKKTLDITLPRTTYVQHKLGETVDDLNDLRMGDLLFFENEDEGVHHVAVYLGRGMYIHAPETGDVVKISSLEQFAPSFAKRVILYNDIDNSNLYGKYFPASVEFKLPVMSLKDLSNAEFQEGTL